jgi:hypothetical protein
MKKTICTTGQHPGGDSIPVGAENRFRKPTNNPKIKP